MNNNKPRIYRTTQTTTQTQKNTTHTKTTHYWAYTCPACQNTYKPRYNPHMPWHQVLAHAQQHRKNCPRTLAEHFLELLEKTQQDTQ